MEQKPIIFDIERFSIHDGPGIRTTVFFTGRPLRCPWCANPESWEMSPVIMRINSKCLGCGLCVNLCPTGAIRMGCGGDSSGSGDHGSGSGDHGSGSGDHGSDSGDNGSGSNGKINLRRQDCVSCGSCVAACPNGALRISGKPMQISEIMEIILKDVDYYKNSGGGVTLSGGEPLMQTAGAVRLLEKCKDRNLHTAIETAGNVPNSDFKRVIPLTNLFLFDIKHCDPEALKEVTGGDLSLILKNLQAAAESAGADVIIRLPVIPGFNDTGEIIDGIYSIAVRYNISKVHLLPYHTLGADKFRQLGMEYPYSCQTNMMSPKRLSPFREIGERRGLTIIV